MSGPPELDRTSAGPATGTARGLAALARITPLALIGAVMTIWTRGPVRALVLGVLMTLVVMGIATPTEIAAAANPAANTDITATAEASWRRIVSIIGRYTGCLLLVQNVSKLYRLYQAPFDRIRELNPLRHKPLHTDFWALRDISFSVDRGEVVSFVGPNGCGKSTLLQVISGILQPTTGRVVTRGRVAALLELGAGFNPEFSGRENVFINGEIMGISRADMQRNLPLIEAFAEIGDFIDRPVKEYSSGMYVRLAFSTAIHVDPDILIVDEAYFEFCGITAADLVTQSSHLIVTRSFSKAFGLAGLRLGYLLAPRQIMDVLSRANNPKSVTSFAKAGALAALRHVGQVHAYVDEVCQSRVEYEKLFKRHGIKYFPSSSNFILFQYDDAKGLIRSLEERNIFVRDRTSQFDGVGHVRISIGGKESTNVAIRALDEFLSGSVAANSEPRTPAEETFAGASPTRVE